MLMVACGVLALLIFSPDIPLSRTLHHWLVVEPVRLAATFDRTRLIFIALLLLLACAGGELVLMLGSAEAVTAFAWQAAVYADALTVSMFAGALARSRALLPWVRTRTAGQPRRAARRKRVISTVQERAANDDDPAPAMAA